jgi:hypothetical protein
LKHDADDQQPHVLVRRDDEMRPSTWCQSDNAHEGCSAFLEKRKPVFTGP